LTAAQFSSAPSGFWSSRSVEDPWTPAICGTNWVLSVECEAQSLLDKRISVRFGQLAADSDFLIDKGASSFLETSWPALLAQDLPSGGPTYPLAATGVRVAITPNDRLGFMIAVFNGDPAGPHCTGDPQLCNNNGLDFRFDSPPLLMAEGSYKYKQDELAGTIKLGGWNHFGNFAVAGLPGKVIHRR